MSFDIQNRRYTGCKMKLTDWIKNVVEENCKNSKSFCDIFGGTGVVTSKFINDYEEFYINDFLYSNEIIYKAFYMKQDYSEPKLYSFLSKVNQLNPDVIGENYVSLNFGNKFFSFNDSKIIGEIRQMIEDNKITFNEKEYCILLASLIYSCDRCSNTCGHYEAYIKNTYIKDSFKFELVSPIINNSCDSRNINIYREDANVLAKQIQADIVYIDPPYSSRQYSRFYHLLETLVKWDKPELFGTAMKPKEENMSDYCKSKALDAFKDLIYSLDCKYIIVSYNNTYSSKSKSSMNKMTLDDIKNVLEKKGNTKIYRKSYKAFNAGKTDFPDHEEVLFCTEVTL